jgi:hypothetical protein
MRGYFLKSKEFREKKCLENTGLQTSTMRRPRSQLGCCCFTDRINMADSVTNTGSITAAGSDLRHFSDRIKALYIKKIRGLPNTDFGFVFIFAFSTRRMDHLCFFISVSKFCA